MSAIAGDTYVPRKEEVVLVVVVVVVVVVVPPLPGASAGPGPSEHGSKLRGPQRPLGSVRGHPKASRGLRKLIIIIIIIIIFYVLMLLLKSQEGRGGGVGSSARNEIQPRAQAQSDGMDAP